MSYANHKVYSRFLILNNFNGIGKKSLMTFSIHYELITELRRFNNENYVLAIKYELEKKYYKEQ